MLKKIVKGSKKNVTNQRLQYEWEAGHHFESW